LSEFSRDILREENLENLDPVRVREIRFCLELPRLLELTTPL
jgi:hypothetical protein